MRGGAIIIATIAIGAAWALARVNPGTDPVLAWLDWGDQPHLSPEMVEGLAAAREIDSAGGSILHGQRPLGFARHIAHDETGPSA